MILEEKKIRHFYQGENLVRPVVVTLEELDEDHPSEMIFEVKISHPATAMTSRQEERPQFPEIFRFQDEVSARSHFDAYCLTLDNVESSAEEIENRENQARVNPTKKHRILKPSKPSKRTKR